MKRILIILCLLCVGFLFAQDIIIDSVYSNPDLDGAIEYIRPNNYFIINTWYFEFGVGDAGYGDIEPHHPNSSYKGFISFYLPDIPVNYEIDSCYVRLFQSYSVGNYGAGNPVDFPVWDVPDGDTIQCIISHIDYGSELDSTDWHKGDPGDPHTYNPEIGVITDSGIDGYRYMDVTNCIRADYFLNRNISQYRIAFEIETDWDNLTDGLTIYTNISEGAEWKSPKLYLKFKQINANSDEPVINKPAWDCYPNPLKNILNVKFSNQFQGKRQIELYNMRGQKVKDFEFSNTSATFNCANLGSGIYFLKLKNNSQMQIKKIVILK